jgi:ubiquinone/menaquinone biosynthesis C-methylase UbiE
MSKRGEEVYTFGYSPTATQIMAARNAKTNAAFFVPHLRTDMEVLDCGCGPGSITLGLAEVVSSGHVLGVDLDASQIDLARAEAAKRGIVNARFDAADVRHLPFPEATFDAVFGHTILMQFRDSLPVLKEMWRVLKPGGMCGLREPAFDGNLYDPPEGARQQYLTLFSRLLEHNGSDPKVGKRLSGLLYEAGFSRVMTSASYEVAGTPETKRLAWEGFARLCEEAEWMKQAISMGWITGGGRDKLAAALRLEGAKPEAFAAMAFGEIIGWKDGPVSP